MLRDYQGELVEAARNGLRKHRAFMVQLATGGGKTAIFSAIVDLIRGLNKRHGTKNRVWIIAPRNELLDQASKHLNHYKIAHGFIRAGMSESRAFDVHIVSKQTLDRRWDKIKNWPNIIIIDEAHLNYEFQAELMARAPLSTRILGFTATPERTNGEGLREKWVGISKDEIDQTKEPMRHREVMVKSDDGLPLTFIEVEKNIGGIYGDIAYGPSIPWLTERGFLAPLRYFAPPIEGLDKLHWRAGEVDEIELDEFLEKRKVYGDVVKYYQKYGRRPSPLPGQNPNKPALIFCRSVKSAKETARHFEEAGFRAIPVYGAMPKEARDHAYQAMREEKIDILTNCDLATFGLDIPNLEYAASIRPTQSRSLYFQKVGRILRPSEGKTHAVFFDHVNLVKYHQLPHAPGIPLFFLDDVQWNFEGRPKRKKEKPADDSFFALCPLKDFQYCSSPGCKSGCALAKDSAIFWECSECKRTIHRDGLVKLDRGMMHPVDGDLFCGPCYPKDDRKDLEVIADVKLKEIKAPVKFNNLLPEEQRSVQDAIGRNTDAAVASLKLGQIDPGPIGELLRIARELGRSPMWVYHRVTEEMKALTVRVPLIYEIQRQLGYKPGWSRYQIESLRSRPRATSHA